MQRLNQNTVTSLREKNSSEIIRADFSLVKLNLFQNFSHVSHPHIIVIAYAT